MEKLFGWIQNTVCFVCLLTVFLQLIPENGFKRYVRFFTGLLLVLVVFQPLAGLLTDQELFDSVFRMEWIKEEKYELESGIRAMEGLRDGAIESAYEAELRRQMGEVALAHGVEAVDIQLKYREEDGISVPDEVTIRGKTTRPQSDESIRQNGLIADTDGLLAEIQEIYHISGDRIHMILQE